MKSIKYQYVSSLGGLHNFDTPLPPFVHDLIASTSLSIAKAAILKIKLTEEIAILNSHLTAKSMPDILSQSLKQKVIKEDILAVKSLLIENYTTNALVKASTKIESLDLQAGQRQSTFKSELSNTRSAIAYPGVITAEDAAMFFAIIAYHSQLKISEFSYKRFKANKAKLAKKIVEAEDTEMNTPATQLTPEAQIAELSSIVKALTLKVNTLDNSSKPAPKPSRQRSPKPLTEKKVHFGKGPPPYQRTKTPRKERGEPAPAHHHHHQQKRYPPKTPRTSQSPTRKPHNQKRPRDNPREDKRKRSRSESSDY
jgi:hypothetical protein